MFIFPSTYLPVKFSTWLRWAAPLCIGELYIAHLVMTPKLIVLPTRTLTYDVGIIFEGEIWLELDGGESKLLRKGDVFAQRG